MVTRARRASRRNALTCITRTRGDAPHARERTHVMWVQHRADATSTTCDLCDLHTDMELPCSFPRASIMNQPSTLRTGFRRATSLSLTLAATGPPSPHVLTELRQTVCVSVYVTKTRRGEAVLRSPRSSLYSERGPLHDLYMTST